MEIMHANHKKLLFKKKEAHMLGEKEDEDTKNWLADIENNDSFFKQITEKNELREKLRIYSSTDSESIWKKILQKIDGSARKLMD